MLSLLIETAKQEVDRSQKEPVQWHARSLDSISRCLEGEERWNEKRGRVEGKLLAMVGSGPGSAATMSQTL